MDFLYYDILFCIVFCAFIALFLYKNKKNVKREGIFYLYKTKFGISFIEKFVNKHKKFLNFITTATIVIGFLGMIAIVGLLVMSVYKMAVMSEVIKTPPIVPLLPWISFPGMPTLYFTIWIIAISLLAIVHEGSHGIFARLNKVKLKSTGFGFLGPIVMAFVEPDEKELVKKSPRAQMSVFAAGPVSNFIVAGIFFLLISFVFNPFYASSVDNFQIKVMDITNSSPAQIAGVEKNDIISIQDVDRGNNTAQYMDNLAAFIKEIKPNQTINIFIENKNKEVSFVTQVSEKNASVGSMGIKGIELTPQFSGIGKMLPFLSALFFWIFATNMFVGLFNLLPFWVVDGGRMFYSAAFAIIYNKGIKNAKKTTKKALAKIEDKSNKQAMKYMKWATKFCLFLIFMIFAVWVLRMLFG